LTGLDNDFFNHFPFLKILRFNPFWQEVVGRYNRPAALHMKNSGKKYRPMNNEKRPIGKNGKTVGINVLKMWINVFS